MPKKLKFKPSITRVKLNPEQVVLSCHCFSTGWGNYGGQYGTLTRQWVGEQVWMCQIHAGGGSPQNKGLGISPYKYVGTGNQGQAMYSHTSGATTS